MAELKPCPSLRELLKSTFEIWCKKRWLKEIDRAIDRHHKAVTKANREFFVVKRLVGRYNEIYNENLWRAEDGK